MTCAFLLSLYPTDDSRYGLEYAVAAYAVIFVAYFAYLWRLFHLVRRVSERVRRLEEAIRPAATEARGQDPQGRP